MHGKNQGSVREQGIKKIWAMYDDGHGTSKFLDKVESVKDSGHFDYQNSECKDKIYAQNTRDAYLKSWNRYCDKMKESNFKCDGHTPRTLSEAAAFMDDYIDSMHSENLSAYSERLFFSGVAKVCGLSAKDYKGLSTRHVDAVTRSRGDNVKSAAARAAHPDTDKFLQSCGLRKFEAQGLTGDHLAYWQDGQPYLRDVVGKGGKIRNIPIRGENAKYVESRCKAAGSGKVFSKSDIPRDFDCHAIRREYAQNYYDSIARPVDTLSHNEVYECSTGTRFDKKALRTVSHALGHSRLNVVAEHYLRR